MSNSPTTPLTPPTANPAAGTPAKNAPHTPPRHADETNEPPVGIALHRVMRAVMFAEKQPTALEALPMAQLRLLWTVHFGTDATMKDLSERLGVSQSTVTQLAEQLVRRGLVERHADASDRRVVRLRTSATGRDILDATRAAQRDMLTAIWDGLTEHERDDVVRGLDILGRAAEAFRAAQGIMLPSLSERDPAQAHAADSDSDPANTQPVLDLMARRVRGRAPA